MSTADDDIRDHYGMAPRALQLDCTKNCTADCGRCKGDPLGTLKRHIMRQLGFSRGAHGGIPFDKKDAWDDGYGEARRAVMRVLYPRPGTPEPQGNADVWSEVQAERDRAHAKHGDTSMESADPLDPEGIRRDIITEEWGEVAREFNEARHDRRQVDSGRLRAELIQLCAMTGAWADALTPSTQAGAS